MSEYLMPLQVKRIRDTSFGIDIGNQIVNRTKADEWEWKS